MKKIKIAFKSKIIGLVLLSILLFHNPGKACSSFAVYSSDTLYAMNFDFPNREMRFSITDLGNHRFFRMEFNEQNNWYVTIGMNERGLMSSTQMVYPTINANVQPGEVTWDFGTLVYTSLSDYQNVSTLRSDLDTNNIRLIQAGGWAIHNHIADKYGNAMVAEVGADSNMFTYPDSNFLVMTNFNNHQFWGRPYTQVSGTGATRYKNAYSYISQNISDFDFDDCLSVLDITKQNGGSYPTICSFVFDPDSNFIYIMLNRNFDKIFRVSLNDEYMETYSGFNYYSRLDMSTSSVLSTQMIALTGIDDQSDTYPKEIELFDNYPNPFNPETNISFQLLESKHVTLKIFNILGHEICTLIDGNTAAGKHSVKWQAEGFASGIYFYKIQTEDFTETKRMLLMR